MTQQMAVQTESVTKTVVSKLADAEGVGPFEVAPLFESIDPDALETLVSNPKWADNVTVEFTHAGYRVTIAGGRVTVDRSTDDT